MSQDTLTRILAYKREEVAARKADIPPADMEMRARDQAPPRGFRAALRAKAAPNRPALIAEIKKASPSKGLIAPNFDPPAIARAYEAGGAACLSVLTDGPSFQGCEADLQAARAACGLPVLRKDFTLDPYQVAEARMIGADAILIILAAIGDALARELLDAASAFGLDALIEVHDDEEMARARGLGGDLVGVNNRDLRTFKTTLETTERLAGRAPANALLVAESGIFTRDDVVRLAAAGARAILVGESLMRSDDPAAAARRLLDGEREHLTD